MIAGVVDYLRAHPRGIGRMHELVQERGCALDVPRREQGERVEVGVGDREMHGAQSADAGCAPVMPRRQTTQSSAGSCLATYMAASALVSRDRASSVSASNNAK